MYACLLYPFDCFCFGNVADSHKCKWFNALVLVLLAGLYQWYQMADLLRAATTA